MKVLIFGASGSAGGGVLDACLRSAHVAEVRAIVRRPLTIVHGKLQQVSHTDFEHYDAVAAAFRGVDACMYCLGKSSTQVASEEEYRRLTYTYAIAAAEMLRRESPAAVFHFISGAGTSADSRYMWARVKAETERALLALGDVMCWRPAAIDGVASTSEPWLFKLLRPTLRLLKPFRTLYVSAEDIGLAMIQATNERLRGRIIENAGIRDLAERARALEQLAVLRQVHTER